jgi:thymidine phosphorylase
MQAIVEAQGASKEPRATGHLAEIIKSRRNGKVISINNLQMARLARLAGAPMDRGAGVDLFKKVGDPVQAGEPLYSIYADFAADFEFALEAAADNSGYRVR